MLRCLCLLVVLAALAPSAAAQREGLLQIGDGTHDFLLRQQAAGRLPGAHLSHLPLSAYEAQVHLDSLARRADLLSRVDRALLARYRGTAPAPGGAWIHRRAGFLYADGRHFASVRGDGYALVAEPVLYAAYGRASVGAWDGASASASVWENTRGVRAAGHLGRHLYFETRLEETQRREARPVTAQLVPRLSYVQRGDDDAVYDYQTATGVVGFRSRFVEARFGRDRNRWGYGQGGLVLSNYAAPYDQLQLRTTVWRLQYVNLFAALTNVADLPDQFGNQILPRRYAALHRLTIALPFRLEASVFEAVVFATDTTADRRRARFDLTYLNPVIFYRAAEADRGSGDNAIVGAGAAWTPVGGLRVYGELLLDELRVSEVGNRWWGNKWGTLVGAHVVDVLPGLSVRAEYARQRPYLFSHRLPANAYLQYGDVLGHPAGPNSVDLSLFVNWTPTPRLHLAADVYRTVRGRDDGAINYGGDPSRSSNTRTANHGVAILQGVRATRLFVEARAAYEVAPGLALSAGLRADAEDDAERGRRRLVAPFALLQWNRPFARTRY